MFWQFQFLYCLWKWLQLLVSQGKGKIMPAVFDNFCVIMIPVLWLLKLILDWWWWWWLLMRDGRLWEVLSNWGATQVQRYIKENPFLDIVKHVLIKLGTHNPELATLTLGLCQAVFTDRFSFMKMMWTAEIQIFKCWYDPCSDDCNLSNCKWTRK